MIMVIHDESGLLEFPSVIKKPLFEPKSQVIPNNHGQDYESSNTNDAPMTASTKKPLDSSENESDGKVKISRKRDGATLSSENSDSISNKISAEDIEELRTVYKKCKSVIRKIEAKYGHLINFEPNQKRKYTINTTDDEENECQCKLNKKIIFDDDGKQIAVDSIPSEHICPKTLRYSQSQTQPNNDLQIEYYNQLIELPDSLVELKTILQNPEIELNYRNLVIQKVRTIKQEYSYEIKFNKHLIVEKLKTNMDEMLDFKGTNLSALPGYVVY